MTTLEAIDNTLQQNKDTFFVDGEVIYRESKSAYDHLREEAAKQGRIVLSAPDTLAGCNVLSKEESKAFFGCVRLLVIQFEMEMKQEEGEEYLEEFYLRFPTKRGLTCFELTPEMQVWLFYLRVNAIRKRLVKSDN